ncbi:AraC family transcriptional regulator [Enterocloster citroniae]|uniref:AraC family transcriptional regulator n=1 Tax=Enterocloster citroniae TaxID=358743 RepID=UPI001D079F5D|nr:AraC family transcriptional regulator [Enterocloster citroniae]MCB7067836.1 AraC family transcriptional regulator [Enterocloster citroniae]
MASIFESHSNTYDGEYFIIKRIPEREFLGTYHYHDFYEAQFYFSDGPDDIGTIMLENKTYTIKNGDIFLINMFESHLIKLFPGINYTRYCIAISPTLMMFICDEHSNLFNIYNKDNKHYPLMNMSLSQQELFLHMYNDFESQLTKLDHGKGFLEQSLLFGVIAMIYNIYYSHDQINLSRSHHMVILTKLVRYIDNHLGEDLSLTRLSEVTNFSECYLCRIFKKDTGTTINKYIVSKRIEASKLLLAGQESINNITRQVGFNNYNNFYRSFKQITGMNPADYRKSITSSESNNFRI